MGHYYVDLMCDDCGKLICICDTIDEFKQPKPKNSIKERAEKVPLEIKLYCDIISYALKNKYITHKDFENE